MVKDITVKYIQYTYTFQNYINVNSNNKKAMKTFEVKFNCQKLMFFFKRIKATVLEILSFRKITLKCTYSIKKQY